MHAACRGPAALQAPCMHVHDYLDLQQIFELQFMRRVGDPIHLKMHVVDKTLIVDRTLTQELIMQPQGRALNAQSRHPMQVLLLDEITVDLDVLARADFLKFLIEDCETRGMTVVYVSASFGLLPSSHAWQLSAQLRSTLSRSSDERLSYKVKTASTGAC